MARRAGVVAAMALLLVAVEITVLVVVARWIGVAPTLLVVLATCALGVVLARREGVRAWGALREWMSAAPGRPAAVSEGAVGVVAAVLLVVPGLVTDVAGLVLLVPVVRRWVLAGAGRLAARRSPVAADLFGPRRVRVRTGADRGPRPDADQPIEGEIIDP